MHIYIYIFIPCCSTDPKCETSMSACMFYFFLIKAATRILIRIYGSDRPQRPIGLTGINRHKRWTQPWNRKSSTWSNPCNCKNLFTLRFVLKVICS